MRLSRESRRDTHAGWFPGQGWPSRELDAIAIAGLPPFFHASCAVSLASMNFANWLAFAAASIVLLLIPGPTVILVVSYALTQGKRVALAVAAGVALGDFTAMTLSLAGLGALLAASATLFTLLK